ncbi:hypothetical protein FA15DRAFT_672033 [Coprinopsis marcescibilis]|uniref:Uncharacterized protein n=1 Tax=Coprinopsis marcescibilis TaxID=230819 RepID=A0A5C3KNI0_COPMA|nr:hypothetical protein FA15DRAFT_672033 [Coprinopsis marcescibilis]
MEPISSSTEAIASLSIQCEQGDNANADNRTKELFSSAKVSLDALSVAFESLHSQTIQMAAVKGSSGSKDSIKFRREIAEQEARHREGMNEIQRIIDDLLENEAAEQFRKQVEQEINEHLGSIVQDCVGDCLKANVSEDLQKEVEDSKAELERARLALHNSESRRLNSKLRSDNADEPLDTLLTADGVVSSHFPKDLNGMFSLDAEACKTLATEYGFPEVSDSRDKNLNRFMQFCGVRYQLVRPTTIQA